MRKSIETLFWALVILLLVPAPSPSPSRSAQSSSGFEIKEWPKNLRTDLKGTSIKVALPENALDRPWDDALIAKFQQLTGITVQTVRPGNDTTVVLAGYLRDFASGSAGLGCEMPSFLRPITVARTRIRLPSTTSVSDIARWNRFIPYSKSLKLFRSISRVVLIGRTPTREDANLWEKRRAEQSSVRIITYDEVLQEHRDRLARRNPR